MTLDTITQHVELVTKVQSLCRQAKETKSRDTLLEVAALLDSDEVRALNREVRLNLQAAYRDAYGAVTGGMAA
ncbi:hypothetical protein [Devosia sp. MC1541]|uniref:hypothetical protein n=1 Tax=Devosia sp. MC1541 TaxID=2725264 RepID=UPI00145F7474|nr:hypothetical protein [Devosia sp. MC1541]